MIIKKQFANDIVWNLLGNIISKGSIFLISIIAARIMSPDDFGRTSYLYQTIALIVIFSSMGLSVTAINFTAKTLNSGRDNISKVVKELTYLVSVFSLIALVFVYFFYEQLLTVLQLNKEDVFIIWILVPVIFFTAINQVQFGVLSGIKKFKKLAITNILAGISSIPIAYILVSQWLIKGFLLSLLFTALLTTIFNRIYIFKSIKEIPKKNDSILSSSSYKEMMSFAWPNLTSSIIFTGSTWVCFSLLAENSLLEVAAFNVSNQLLGVLFIFPTICAQVLMTYTSDKSSESRNLFFKSLIFNGVSAALLAGVMMFFGSFLLGFYGEHYQEYTSVLYLCLVTLVIMALSSQVEHYMVGLGLVKSHLGYTIVYSLIFVGMSLYLISYGAVGIAAARLIAYVVKFSISFWFVNKVNYVTSR